MDEFKIFGNWFHGKNVKDLLSNCVGVLTAELYKLRRCLIHVDKATKNNMRTIPPNTLKSKKKLIND